MSKEPRHYLVPEEPTEEMLVAGMMALAKVKGDSLPENPTPEELAMALVHTSGDVAAVYRAMYAAAPDPTEVLERMRADAWEAEAARWEIREAHGALSVFGPRGLELHTTDGEKADRLVDSACFLAMREMFAPGGRYGKG